jgi:nucleoid DNA-binding protein
MLLPPVEIMDREQANRFMRAFQELIAAHILDTGGIYLSQIGLFEVVPNNFSVFRKPATGESVPKAHDFRVRYSPAHVVDGLLALP